MPQLARLLLLLFALIVLWNLARGSLRDWLRAKFLGDGTTPAAGRPSPRPRAGRTTT